MRAVKDWGVRKDEKDLSQNSKASKKKRVEKEEP